VMLVTAATPGLPASFTAVTAAPTKAQAEEALLLVFPDSGDVRSEFSQLAVPEVYAAGEALFHEGGPSQGAFLLCDGEVEVSVKRARNSKLVLERAQAGNVLGVSATLRGSPYMVSAVALRPCKVLHLGPRAFLDLLQRHPSASLAISRQLSVGLEEAYHGLRSLRGVKRRHVH
jgi:CRP-like cAMP-binding protein